jgi:DNA-binding NtrC family response regulator
MEARSGADALELAGGYEGTIDLLVTDVVMPGMNGPALAEGLQKARPGLAVIYVSGYPEESRFRAAAGKPGATVLAKPLRPEVLTRAVRRVLDKKRNVRP